MEAAAEAVEEETKQVRKKKFEGDGDRPPWLHRPPGPHSPVGHASQMPNLQLTADRTSTLHPYLVFPRPPSMSGRFCRPGSCSAR